MLLFDMSTKRPFDKDYFVKSIWPGSVSNRLAADIDLHEMPSPYPTLIQ